MNEPTHDLDAALEQIDCAIRDGEVEALPAVVAALSARIGAASARLLSTPAPSSNDHDTNLDVRAAAERMGVSTALLYKNAKRLPFTVRVGRRVLFSAHGLDRWIKQRAGRK